MCSMDGQEERYSLEPTSHGRQMRSDCTDTGQLEEQTQRKQEGGCGTGRRGSELGFMGHSRGPERWLRCVPVTPGPRGGQVDPGALRSASLASHQVLAAVRDLTAGGELFRQILDIDL